jgi:adhesin HecA-like repeat protein
MRPRTILLVFGAVALLAPAAGFGAAGAGTLDFDPPGAPTIGDFGGVTLNGSAQLTSLTIEPFGITDSTGSGAGWHIRLTISDLVNGGSTIAASTLTMDAPAVSSVNGSDLTNVEGHATTGNLATGENIVTAAVGYGMGSYLVSPRPLRLEVPVDARSGTYSGTGSLTIDSGP